MRAVRGRDTGPELALRRALWREGVRGWRTHLKDVPGRPDIGFRNLRTAVFVDGDFWHGRDWPALGEKLTPEWRAKIGRNRERDRAVTLALEMRGWLVLRFWETDIGRDPGLVARLVAEQVRQRRVLR